jgi:hypothetical protein
LLNVSDHKKYLEKYVLGYLLIIQDAGFRTASAYCATDCKLGFLTSTINKNLQSFMLDKNNS